MRPAGVTAATILALALGLTSVPAVGAVPLASAAATPDLPDVVVGLVEGHPIPAGAQRVIDGVALVPAEEVLALVASGAVAWVEPVGTMSIAEEPVVDDPCWVGCDPVDQEYLHRIRADVAWQAGNGSPSVRVAVIDNGVDVTHPELADKVADSIDVIGDTGLCPDADPPGDHATHVAGLVAAATDDGIGIASLGRDTALLDIKALCGTNGTGTSTTVAAAIDAAVAAGADVINLSVEPAGAGSELQKVIVTAIKRAIAANVLVVAAAGNHGSATTTGFGFMPKVTVVGAVDEADEVASFSNRGTWVDVSAPGTDILSLYAGDAYALENGTSMATPQVAATAALLRARDPNLNTNQLAKILRVTSDGAGAGDTTLHGRLDAGSATHMWPAYGTFGGGTAIAFGDVDGDGIDEIITGAGRGGRPHVLVRAVDGTRLASFWGMPKSFTGGITVAAGDLDGDGDDEIIVGAGRYDRPLLRTFEGDGTRLGEVDAYPAAFKGGVYVASGDVDGDGTDEVITGSGRGAPSQVVVRHPDLTVQAAFSPFPSSFQGGVRVASGDVDGDGRTDVVLGKGPEQDPLVSIRSMWGAEASSFIAYAPKFKGGINVGVADLDGDGTDEVVTGAGRGGGPHIRAFSAGGTPRASWFAFEPHHSGGVYAGGWDTDGDGIDTIVGSQNTKGAWVRLRV